MNTSRNYIDPRMPVWVCNEQGMEHSELLGKRAEGPSVAWAAHELQGKGGYMF